MNKLALFVGCGSCLASVAVAQTTQPLQVYWDGPATINVGQTAVFTLTANTSAFPGDVQLFSFGALLSNLGAAASIQNVTVATPPWISIPIDPFTVGGAGISMTPLSGIIELLRVEVRGEQLGSADLNFTQPFGDNRFVFNAQYNGTVECFAEPIEVTGAGSGMFQVVPAPGSIALLGLGSLVATRRRRS